MTVISKFIPIDPDNLPDEEVLAINEDSDILIGELEKERYSGCKFGITCDNGHGYELYNVTAYIPVSQLVELYKQGD